MSLNMSGLVIPDILDEMSEDMRRQLIDKQFICVSKLNSNSNELNQLKNEIKRLESDLKFANKCINTLNLFKKFLNGIRYKFESLLDSKQRLELNSLELKYKSIIEKIRERNPNFKTDDQNSGQLVNDLIDLEHNYNKLEQNEEETQMSGISGIDDGFDRNSNEDFVQKDSICLENSLRTEELYSKIAGPPFECPVVGCKKVYNRRVHLNRHLMYGKDHLKMEFDPKLRLKCNYCTFRCDSQKWMEKHLKVHNDINCQYCGRNYFSQSGLLTHLRSVHFDKPLTFIIKCRVNGCHEVFNTFAARDKHIKGYHKRQYLCNVCDFVADNQINLIKHKYTHKASFVCTRPQCSRRFHNRLALESHLKRHKKDNSKNFRSNNLTITHIITNTTESIDKNNSNPDVSIEFSNNVEPIDNKKLDISEKSERNHPLDSRYPIKCSVVGCKKRFSNKRCLIRHLIYGKQHLNLEFDKNLRIKCKMCSFRCDSQKWIQMHTKVHNDYNCQYCGKNYFSKTGLQTHIRAVHSIEAENDVIKCTAIGCDLEFGSTYALSTHMKRVHKMKPYSCSYPECDFEGRYPFELEDHIYQHTGENPYNCDVPGCDYMGENRKKLYWHKYDKHNAGPVTLKCEHCPFTCKNNSLMKKHIVCHTNSRPFECSLCQKTFKSNNALNYHMRIHSSGPFKCRQSECQLEFPSLHQRNIHFKVVHQRKHLCSWPGCEYVAPNKAKLTHHKNLHTGVLPFKCNWPECGFVARSNHNLIHHKYRHTGERPYPCNWPECDKRFRTGPAFETHMRMHRKDLC